MHWGEDNEILDFAPNAAYSIYNWELFFHNPLYVAGLLSQNLQFEDAMKWYHYIFDPTKQGSDPAPQRFWIPKPLHNLTSTAVQAQRINNLLALVNQGDPDAIAQVRRWRDDPFNPYLLADMRPVAYMKNVVMAYLDNIMAWADNLFATDSREALSEATLLYVIASEILGPEPSAIRPPQHAAWVDKLLLMQILAGNLTNPSVEYSLDIPSLDQAKRVLRRTGEFVGLVDKDGIFVNVINRGALLEKLAAMTGKL